MRLHLSGNELEIKSLPAFLKQHGYDLHLPDQVYLAKTKVGTVTKVPYGLFRTKLVFVPSITREELSAITQKLGSAEIPINLERSNDSKKDKNRNGRRQAVKQSNKETSKD
jgi:hypothetical protein